MKNPKAAKIKSAAKAKIAPKGIDDYLAGVPEPARSTLEKVRTAIRASAPPEATETISYGVPAYKLTGVPV